jgi:hypothetical protein
MLCTHMFWAYGNLSNLEQLCISSFLKNKYELMLWTYGEIPNAPSRAIIRNAREILPESIVFLNRFSSYASFSDLFRYAVLNKLGGLYVDTDVIALKRENDLPADPFLVTERTQNNSLKACNNVIFNPKPVGGNIIDLAFAYSERFPKNEINWGEIGPELLTAIVRIHPNHGFKLMGPEFANSIDWWKCPSALLEAGAAPTADAAFLHLYNEMWRRAKVNKDAPFPQDSLMQHLVCLVESGPSTELS